MDELKTIYTAEKKEWRKWFELNFKSEKEVWLIYPKKTSGKPRILYNDAVEEALCFGWIDSIIRSLDENNTIQKFSPRNPKSNYSQANKERIKWLYQKKLIHPTIENVAKEIVEEDFIFPLDIIEFIKKDKEALKNYKNFSMSYKRIRIAYIDSARNRPEEFKKRLLNFLEKSRDNKLIKGYGGIDKYY